MLEGKRTNSVEDTCTSVRVYFKALVRKSEDLCSLSDEAKQRYESKVVGTGHSVDPYTYFINLTTGLEIQRLFHS